MLMTQLDQLAGIATDKAQCNCDWLNNLVQPIYEIFTMVVDGAIELCLVTALILQHKAIRYVLDILMVVNVADAIAVAHSEECICIVTTGSRQRIGGEVGLADVLQAHIQILMEQLAVLIIPGSIRVVALAIQPSQIPGMGNQRSAGVIGLAADIPAINAGLHHQHLISTGIAGADSFAADQSTIGGLMVTHLHINDILDQIIVDGVGDLIIRRVGRKHGKHLLDLRVHLILCRFQCGRIGSYLLTVDGITDRNKPNNALFDLDIAAAIEPEILRVILHNHQLCQLDIRNDGIRLSLAGNCGNMDGNGRFQIFDAIGNILVNGALRIGRQLLIAIAFLARSLRRQQERQQQGKHAKDRQYTDPCLSHRNYLSFPIAVSHYAVY